MTRESSTMLPFTLSAIELVPAPRAIRKLAVVLIAMLMLVPIVLVLTPWRQNIPAAGRVVALNPLDRLQTIPAPVTGRLVKLLVQEGDQVQEGDVLAEMADQDPQFAERLQQQLDFAEDKVDAARREVQAYTQQLENLTTARELALSTARFERSMEEDAVRAAEQKRSAAEAELRQKQADRDRRERLFRRGVVSELDFQKAEADFLAAEANLEAARADVARASNSERARDAEIGRISSDLQARIDATESSREQARAKVALAEKERTDARTAVERQQTQVVRAPRDGRVFRINAASSADLLKQGDPLLVLVPEAQRLAVELWVRGNDAPLIEPGRTVRLQFEGWPAVQFAGWPSVAVGTFGGQVLVVDAQDDGQGRFRILVEPDPQDQQWPDQRFLRQGVRANGWVLLEDVPLGFEFWRQLNGFPPTVAMQATEAGGK